VSAPYRRAGDLNLQPAAARHHAHHARHRHGGPRRGRGESAIHFHFDFQFAQSLKLNNFTDEKIIFNNNYYESN
jgi:hypothetical protein